MRLVTIPGIRHLMRAALITALWGVSSVQQAEAEEGYHCDGCYFDEGGTSISCGVLRLNAISGCCAMGTGDAYCDGDHWNVICQSGGQCQCNKYGDYCSS